jgi:hypothetical protein
MNRLLISFLVLFVFAPYMVASTSTIDGRHAPQVLPSEEASAKDLFFRQLHWNWHSRGCLRSGDASGG